MFPITVLAPLAVDTQPPALTTFVGGPVVTSPPQVKSNHPVAPVTWTLGTGTLPPGTTLAADGSLSGTATQASTAGSPFTLALNGVDASTAKDPVVGGAAVSVTVQPAMTLPVQTAMGFRVGTNQSASVVAGHESARCRRLRAEGNIARGPDVPTRSGRVSGTPTTAGTATVTVTATDSASKITPTAANQTASQPLAVNVLGALTLTPPIMSAVVAHVGSTVSVTLPTVGNSPVAPAPGWTAHLRVPLPSPVTLTSTGTVSLRRYGPARLGGRATTRSPSPTRTPRAPPAHVAFTLSVRGPLSIDAAWAPSPT